MSDNTKNGAEEHLLRLVIVRHGETTANAADIIQGQSLDPSFRLTELGRAQASAMNNL